MTTPRSNRKTLRTLKYGPPPKKVKLIDQAKPASPVAAGWLAVVAVLLLTFLVYSPTLKFNFVSDDVPQVVQNLHVQSWSYLPDFFTKHLWSQEGDKYLSQYYRPLFLVWLCLNHSLFGLDTFYWHLTTLAAHLLTTFLVYVLVFVLLRRWWPAALAALYFGLHPIHVEVAAWVSAVSEALLASALIAALLCFFEGAKKKSYGWHAGSLLCYASALLMKETAIVFPVVVFVFAWLWFDGEDDRGRTYPALLRTVPFLLLTAMYLIVRHLVLKNIMAVTTPFGLKTLALTLPSVLVDYGKLLVWPVVSLYYHTPQVHKPGWSRFAVPVLVIVVLACVLALLVRKAWSAANGEQNARAEGRLTILACVWMVVFLLPVLYLSSLHDGLFIEDRYLYLPSVGFVILLSLGLCSFGRASRKVLGVPRVQVTAALVLAALMAFGTVAQSQIWKDNLALFTRAVEKDPGNREAQYSLVAALGETGDFDEAVERLQQLMREYPDDPASMTVRHNLAATLSDAGRNDAAIGILTGLLRQDPNNYVDNNNMGQAYLHKGDRVHAEFYLARSCQMHPTAQRLYQLGAVQFNLGKFATAEQTFSQAIAMNPVGLHYHSGLGLALEQLGKTNLAIKAFQQELVIDPGDQTSRQQLSRLSASERPANDGLSGANPRLPSFNLR